MGAFENATYRIYDKLWANRFQNTFPIISFAVTLFKNRQMGSRAYFKANKGMSGKHSQLNST